VLSGSTRLVGIIGDPVVDSLSPRMHNAAFEAVGLHWAYVPLPVRAESLGAAIRGLAALGFAGANVTIPHKTAVLPFCDELDGVARRAASVNTLVVRKGRVHGSSTDGLGVKDAVEVEGARVLVLGAGGAAQAVAVAAAEARAASVTVSARRPEQAEELAGLVGSRGRTAGWPPPVAEADVLVNATPLKEELVIAPLGHQVVVDLAYLPDGRETALVAAARAAGCPTVVDGLEVLVRQGAASFERWTGVPAPVEVMRRAVRSA
jgi:shikimate dehydrogenase